MICGPRLEEAVAVRQPLLPQAGLRWTSPVTRVQTYDNQHAASACGNQAGGRTRCSQYTTAMHKPIILIGGASGCGKTTLARRLCHALEIDHRLSTGFIREILRDQTSSQEFPALFTYTFEAPDPVQDLVEQSEILARYVRVCIHRAVEEGSSLIIEGNHLIPALYHAIDCDLYLILAAPALQEHYRRLTGKSHARRSLTRADLARARVIADYLEREAAAFGLPYMSYDGEIEDILNLLSGESCS